MVGVDDEHRVLPQVELVHQIENASQLVVAHGVQRGILHAQVIHFLVGLGHAGVWGPVEMPSAVIVGIQILVFLMRKKGFVRVEGFYMQKPVILAVIGPDKFESLIKSPPLRLLFGRGHVFAVDPILSYESSSASLDRFGHGRGLSPLPSRGLPPGLERFPRSNSGG